MRVNNYHYSSFKTRLELHQEALQKNTLKTKDCLEKVFATYDNELSPLVYKEQVQIGRKTVVQ